MLQFLPRAYKNVYANVIKLPVMTDGVPDAVYCM